MSAQPDFLKQQPAPLPARPHQATNRLRNDSAKRAIRDRG